MSVSFKSLSAAFIATLMLVAPALADLTHEEVRVGAKVVLSKDAKMRFKCKSGFECEDQLKQYTLGTISDIKEYAGHGLTASVNGKSVTVGELKALGEKLIDIHSQHQNLLLSQEDFQLQVLDLLEDADLSRDTQAYGQFTEAQQRLNAAKAAMHRSREDEE